MPIAGSTVPPLRYEEAAPVYAGFWWRFLAYVIDTVLLFVGFELLAIIVGIIAVAVMSSSGTPTSQVLERIRGAQTLATCAGLMVNWLYFTIMESSSLQATVGKRLLHIRVTDLNWKRISFARANGRYFLKFLSGLPLGIGYLVAFKGPKHQALHDRNAGTYVMRTTQGR
jgi:uncharacterized RDD family membrane protein YckC